MGNELVMGYYHFLIKRKIMRTEDNKGKKNPITLKLLHKSDFNFQLQNQITKIIQL